MREMAERLPRRRNESEEKVRKLDRQCWELAEKLRSEPAPENAEELQKQLAALVAESIDSMIDETKQRLAEVQARLNQMERLRDRIVQQRLDFYLKAPKENSPSSPAAKN